MRQLKERNGWHCERRLGFPAVAMVQRMIDVINKAVVIIALSANLRVRQSVSAQTWRMSPTGTLSSYLNPPTQSSASLNLAPVNIQLITMKQHFHLYISHTVCIHILAFKILKCVRSFNVTFYIVRLPTKFILIIININAQYFGVTL